MQRLRCTSDGETPRYSRGARNWKKKIEVQLASGAAKVEEFTPEEQKRKHEKRLADIEAVRKLREQRELEKEQREEERERKGIKVRMSRDNDVPRVFRANQGIVLAKVTIPT